MKFEQKLITSFTTSEVIGRLFDISERE